ncbi:MOSC domain-containing protein [Halobaculum sp. MBLA0143]|uniref:MOSC domain-containing protein n=1 Tax=Halobaculum sp. MBLA0143 TaxID=3079933 RepID=UPI00352458A5
MDATVRQLFTAPEGGAAMEPRETVTCREGGIVDDRYFDGSGTYAPFDTCEVTFVSWAAVETIREQTGIDLSDGRHRRNVVLAGAEPTDLLDTTFRVGGVTFRGTRRRPPCAHVEEVADEAGVEEALGDGRGGICADVVEGGELAVGDRLELVEADPRSVGAEIAERLGAEGDG